MIVWHAGRMPDFDFDASFGDDYLHFYLPVLADDRNDADTIEIIAALDLAPGHRLLDAPCGHGRISNRLAERGMTVCGIDRSPHFIDLARQDARRRGVEVDYRVADITSLPREVDGGFDAAINWFTSFGYHDDQTCRAVLAEYHRVLRPGGRLLIETLHRDWFVRNHPPAPYAASTRIGDDLMLDWNTFEPSTGRVNTIRTVVRDGQVRTSTHFIRLPAATELQQWLTDAGFSNIAITGRNAAPLTLDSRRLLAISTA